MELSTETLLKIIKEQNESLKEVFEAKLTHNMAETRLLFDDVYRRQDIMIEHQKETNGKVKKNTEAIIELEKCTSEGKKYFKILDQMWKYKYLIAVSVLVLFFSMISLYTKIDIKRTIEGKTGVKFKTEQVENKD